MSGQREDLLNRLRALKQRTVENGCTEAEALTAATLLAKLIDRYGFDQSDLEMPLEPITEEAYVGRRKMGQETYVMYGIQAYCDIKVWQQKRYVIGSRTPVTQIVMFGRESDVAVARYLLDLIRTALDSEWKAFRKQRVFARNNDRTMFERGMCWRISERLTEMKKARNAEFDAKSGKTGQDLVVVKNAVVEEAFAKRGLKLGKARKARATTNWGAVQSGMKAGDRVALNPGVGGKAARQLT